MIRFSVLVLNTKRSRSGRLVFVTMFFTSFGMAGVFSTKLTISMRPREQGSPIWPEPKSWLQSESCVWL